MELEFDNEIDALLRKARDDRGVLVGDTLKLHLDADEIAAFAENVLPDSTKQTYVAHFADCEGCRKTLSSVILLNSEAGIETASVVSAPVIAENAVPWYRKLFLFPNLAYVMGSLVLLFSGFLAISVLKNSSDRASSEVSQTSAEPALSGPNLGYGDSYSNSNTSVSSVANTAANITANAANATGNASAPSNPAFAANTVLPADAKNQPPAISVDGITTGGDAPATAAAPQPPPPPKERPAAMDDRTVTSEEKRSLVFKDSDKQKAESRVMQQQAPPGAGGPFKVQKGPSRNEQRNDARMRENELASKKAAKSDSTLTSNRRQVGGRTFEFKQSVWYDSAYGGQTTTNVRRGTDEYRKLDSGLRSIADSLYGTVVVIWKEKAYRIQ